MTLGRREWACIAILAAIPTAAWWRCVLPVKAAKAGAMSELKEQQSKVEALRGASGMIPEMERAAAGLKKAVESLRSKLPRQNEVDKVVKEIWQLAETNRLGLKNIQTEGSDEAGEGDAPPYPAQSLSFQIEGDFAGFYAFMLELENEPRVIRIQKMGVGITKGDVGQVQASLLIKVYYQP
jgi:Tfp pilus assembly protein PilO